jgi:hypothetical protein
MGFWPRAGAQDWHKLRHKIENNAAMVFRFKECFVIFPENIRRLSPREKWEV